MNALFASCACVDGLLFPSDGGDYAGDPLEEGLDDNDYAYGDIEEHFEHTEVRSGGFAFRTMTWVRPDAIPRPSVPAAAYGAAGSPPMDIPSGGTAASATCVCV